MGQNKRFSLSPTLRFGRNVRNRRADLRIKAKQLAKSTFSGAPNPKSSGVKMYLRTRGVFETATTICAFFFFSVPPHKKKSTETLCYSTPAVIPHRELKKKKGKVFKRAELSR